MCTAVTYQTGDFYFGRTLDYEFSYGEEVVLTPRNYPMTFRYGAKAEENHAILGMAHIRQGYPLYYDGINEKGLAMAGLNFVGNARYFSPDPQKENVAQFELITWILRQCATLEQARELLDRSNITGDPFSDDLPPAQLHWIIADQTGSIVIESMADGLHIHENPVGVLTNNPPFPMQLSRLHDFMHLSSHDPKNTFSDRLSLKPYSRGMGGIGLPGDLSSGSRFVRAAFVKLNSMSDGSEGASVSQFFHILGSVAQQRGCCCVGEGAYEITIYTSCCNATKGIYYYTTYENQRINAVDMHRENLNGKELRHYPLKTEQDICPQNR